MAIQFARSRIVARSRGGNAVRSAAYNSRSQIYDERTGFTFAFRDHGTLTHHEILLPPGVDPAFQTPAVLFNAVEQAERRVDAQLLREVVLALPRDPGITDEDRAVLARTFAEERFVSKGLAVQLDIHSPHGAEENPHAHLLVSLRRIEGGSLGRLKVREAAFYKINGRPMIGDDHHWGRDWGAHQDEYFRVHGKPVTVDPVAPVPTQHIGPKRFRHPDDPRIAENAKRLEMSKVLAADPQSAVEHLSRQRVYRGAGVERFFEKHIADPELRQLVKAEVLPKLAELQMAALIKASQADMLGSTAPMGVEDVARDLSPRLAKILKKEAELREEGRKVDFVIRKAALSLEDGKARVAYRKEKIGLPRKLLHATGLYTDIEIDRGTVQQKRAEGGGAKLKIRKKRILDQLAALRLAAVKVLDDGAPSLRERAKHELEIRRRMSRNARAELAAIQKADAAVQKADRVQRLRRSPALRP